MLFGYPNAPNSRYVPARVISECHNVELSIDLIRGPVYAGGAGKEAQGRKKGLAAWFRTAMHRERLA